MKKTLCLVLSLLLAFALLPFAGVAAEEAPLTGEISVQAEEGWMDYYKAAIDRVLEANPDAKINLIEMGAFDHLDTIDNTDAGNPDVADVFAIPADRIYGLTDAEVLGAIDAEKLVEKIGGWKDFEAFNEGIGGNFKIEDEYFAFPFNIETLIVFINSANAEAHEIDIEKPIELTEVKDPATVLLPAFDAWYGVALSNSAEIELLGREKEEDAEDYTFFSDLTSDWSELPEEKQAFFTALYDYWKLNFDANTTLFDPEAGWGYIDDNFTSGQAGAYRLGGPWDTGAISKKANDGEDLVIKPITDITINGKPLLHWKGGWGLAINSRIEGDEEKVALAEALIAELVNPEHAAELFNATGKILENVPAEDYEKFEDLKDIDKDVIKAVIESYQDAPARPLFNEWGRVWDTYKNAVLSWNSVKPESAEAAYAELQASFVAMMETLAAEQ